MCWRRLSSLAAAPGVLQGFPGTVQLSVVYTLTDGGELWVEMQATAGAQGCNCLLLTEVEVRTALWIAGACDMIATHSTAPAGHLLCRILEACSCVPALPISAADAATPINLAQVSWICARMLGSCVWG